ncbi:cardiolipin synthase [Massilia sp. WF1]|uniref:cardiolipin synthase n=1 Tax=unclassified Massilia TaxID=2609279 RepID=UPI00064A9D47|nr:MULTISPECIES: cardiolipin synthase [unclassified Massilia]ALK96494.1 cardiolipin synthase B [Massilia sp. WG5]KLU36336.1 cardiolipin synthase [Massilia sp. WF1]
MNFPRLQAWLAALCLGLVLTACKTLPDVDPAAPAKANPTVAGSKGRLAPKQVSALVSKRWSNATADLKSLAVLEEQATGVPLIAGNKVMLLFDGPATMREMMAAARAATNSINLETYIFDQDQVGNEFADVLIEKQRQGVQVNIMVDAVGAIATPAAFFDRMRAAGIRVLIFNPVNPAKAKGNWDLNNRNHRKLMVVDGRIAFTGGINISSTYANSSLFRSHHKPDNVDGSKVGWRDTHVKIEGPAVAPLQWSFVDLWVQQEGGELPKAEYFPTLTPAGDKLIRVLAGNPEGDSDIYKALVVAITEAKKSIHITSAYFVPDQQIVDALADAAGRGVDVRLVLPGVSDHSLIRYAGQGFYDQLLKAGVKIFELQVAVLHAKTAVIDSGWSTIGSANIDRRSFLHNYELNVVVMDPAFGRDMESAFSDDLRTSKEVTLEQWRHRPWMDRIREWMARLGEYWI